MLLLQAVGKGTQLGPLTSRESGTAAHATAYFRSRVFCLTPFGTAEADASSGGGIRNWRSRRNCTAAVYFAVYRTAPPGRVGIRREFGD